MRSILESPDNIDNSVSGYLGMSAIRKGDVILLKEIIDLTTNNSLNPKEANTVTSEVKAPSFRKLLHVAAEFGSEEMCRYLVAEAGFSASNFEAVSEAPWSSSGATETPVHSAARGNNVANMTYLANEAGGDFNACSDTSHAWTPLHAAVAAKSLEAVYYLLTAGAKTMSPVKFSSTPLHVASEHNVVECAEALLQNNVLVDALRDERKRETPLHLAASQVKFLKD